MSKKSHSPSTPLVPLSWLDTGLSSCDALMWAGCGFDPPAVIVWMLYDFSLTAARQWQSVILDCGLPTNNVAVLASRLRLVGWTPASVRVLYS